MEDFLLEVKDLNKHYGDIPILKNISFSIKKGEVLVVLGPSGCGKSTLLRCLNGLEGIDSGLIKLEGQKITNGKAQWSEIRQKVGMVFQSYDLFPHMTVLDNLTLGPLKAQKRDKSEVLQKSQKLLARIGLKDKSNAFPRQLSGGQKQRVAILRALMMNPEIILFDEVTASLDPEMVHEVLDMILELAAEGMTMIIVTHEMSFAKATADKVLFMDEGQIAEITVPEQFFSQPKTTRAAQFLDNFEYKSNKNRKRGN